MAADERALEQFADIVAKKIVDIKRANALCEIVHRPPGLAPDRRPRGPPGGPARLQPRALEPFEPRSEGGRTCAGRISPRR